jgi:hypothetical protein
MIKGNHPLNQANQPNKSDNSSASLTILHPKNRLKSGRRTSGLRNARVDDYIINADQNELNMLNIDLS